MTDSEWGPVILIDADGPAFWHMKKGPWRFSVQQERRTRSSDGRWRYLVYTDYSGGPFHHGEHSYPSREDAQAAAVAWAATYTPAETP